MTTTPKDAADITRPTHESSLPQLPLEIWAIVFGYLVNNNDFSHVWVDCRRVSKSFKRAAELAFISEALRQIEVQLSLIGCVGRNYGEVARLQFKGFSEDGLRVHYGEPGNDQLFLRDDIQSERGPGIIHDDRDQGNLPLLIEWTSNIYISVCRGPVSYYSWSVQYKHQLCHVWLRPNSERTMGMVVHHKNHEVSFLWQAVLNTFFKMRLEAVRAMKFTKREGNQAAPRSTNVLAPHHGENSRQTLV